MNNQCNGRYRRVHFGYTFETFSNKSFRIQAIQYICSFTEHQELEALSCEYYHRPQTSDATHRIAVSFPRLMDSQTKQSQYHSQ